MYCDVESANKVPFLVQALKAQYGEEVTERILHGMHARRITTLRTNRLKTTPEQVEQQLSAAGIACSVWAMDDGAFLLSDAHEAAVQALPMYERGEIYLQSLSSMLPPLALEPKENADILDMAAAPGGKTAQMASMTGNRANITACEINKIRAEKLKYNLDKQGATRVNIMVRDARKLEDFFRFDQILLDAPCSGSGTILLDEPGTYRAFSEKLVRNSAATQLALLKKALTILKKGGSMVYSTCSILSLENERVVQTALKGASAHVEPLELSGMADLPLLPCSLPGALCVCPTEQYEGFFVAKIRKDK